MKKILGTTAFPIFCILLSFFVLTTDSRFTYSLLEQNESIQPTKELMNYFVSKGQIPEAFNEEEKSHLQDVKQLIKFGLITLLITLMALIYCSSEWKKTIRYGTIALSAILAAGFIIPFNTLFTRFHYIFFPQGNWAFPPESALITYYPANFFATYALSIAVYAIFLGLIMVHFTYINKK